MEASRRLPRPRLTPTRHAKNFTCDVTEATRMDVVFESVEGWRLTICL